MPDMRLSQEMKDFHIIDPHYQKGNCLMTYTHSPETHMKKNAPVMKTVSQTLTTLIVTSLVLLGSAAVSQAAGSFSIAGDTEFSSLRGDPTENLGNPNEPDGPGTGSGSCITKGKITRIIGMAYSGKPPAAVRIINDDGVTTSFTMRQHSDYVLPMAWDILKEAWLHNLTVRIVSIDGPCTFKGHNTYSGGDIDSVVHLPAE